VTFLILGEPGRGVARCLWTQAPGLTRRTSCTIESPPGSPRCPTYSERLIAAHVSPGASVTGREEWVARIAGT